MSSRYDLVVTLAAVAISSSLILTAAQGPPQPSSQDASERAQQQRSIQPTRPEQMKTSHDQSDIFKASNAMPVLHAVRVVAGPPPEWQARASNFCQLGVR